MLSNLFRLLSRWYAVFARTKEHQVVHVFGEKGASTEIEKGENHATDDNRLRLHGATDSCLYL